MRSALPSPHGRLTRSSTAHAITTRATRSARGAAAGRRPAAWRIATFATFAAIALLTATACQPSASHDEVLRVPAPGGSGLDAVLVEVNGGATATYRYDVFVVPQGAATGAAQPALSLTGATRNAQAYGAHLRWTAPTRLRVEYLQARSVQGQGGPVAVGGQTVQIDLAPGTADPSAPPGGMDYNRRQTASPSAAGSR